jgi:hypothetical protein
MQNEMSKCFISGVGSPAATASLIGAAHDAAVMRNLLNIIVDGEGLASGPRASALALASLKYLDDIEEAVRSAVQSFKELQADL